MNYNLTEKQKKLIEWIVQKTRNNELEEGFIIIWGLRSDQPLIQGYSGNKNEIPQITIGFVDALATEKMLMVNPLFKTNYTGENYEYSRRCSIMQKAYEAVDNGFDIEDTNLNNNISIGAIINNMSGGNLQALGNIQNSSINQSINDPELLRQEVKEITENLLKEVRNCLSNQDFLVYSKAVDELRQEVLKQKPNPSIVKRIVNTIGLLGDIEGTIALMTRVWPFVQPLLLIVAAKLGS